MAIAHLHAGVIQRSAGKSAVGAAAYAARVRMVDLRTGEIHDYSRRASDVVWQAVFLPKGADAKLRDVAAFANALEAAEKRKDAQTARTIELAIPHELTPEERQWLVQDYGREQFTRKGLAYHVAIHQPHPQGDQRNHHAHYTIATRKMDETGFTKKDRESDRQEALEVWRDNWEKLANRHLERHGHRARISMKTLEAQGIEREPQIHQGQGATALERKGTRTNRGDLVSKIANDNGRRGVANGLHQGAEDPAETPLAEPDITNLDEQNAVNAAGIDYAEERRRQFFQQQALERETVEQSGRIMTERHAEAWTEVLQRHAAEATSGYQPGTIEEAGEVATSTFSFFLSLFASIAESITNTGRRGTAKAKPDKAKEKREERLRQQQEQHARELEAIHAEQARERAEFERRRLKMLDEQERSREHFEELISERSALQNAFDVHLTTSFDRSKGTEKPQREKDGPGLEL